MMRRRRTLTGKSEERGGKDGTEEDTKWKEVKEEEEMIGQRRTSTGRRRKRPEKEMMGQERVLRRGSIFTSLSCRSVG